MDDKKITGGGDGSMNPSKPSPEDRQESTQSNTKNLELYAIIILLCGILCGILLSKFSEFGNVPINGNMGDVNDKIVKLTDQYSSFQEKLEVQISGLQSSIEKEGDTRINALADLRSDLDDVKKTSVLKRDNDRTINELNTVLSNVKKNLLDKETKQNELTHSVDTLKSNEDRFNYQLTVFKNKINDDLNTIKSEIRNALAEVKLDTTNQIDDAKNALYDVTITLEKIERAKTKIEDTLTGQEDLLSLVHQNTFNKASGIVAILLLYFLLMALAMYVLCNRPHGKQKRNLHHNYGVQDEILYPRVAGISNANLANAVCVISFDEDTQNHYHRLLMTTVIEGLTGQLKNTLQVRYHVIRQNDEIRNIPATKLYVIFADFSERHVIIEQRGIGLGDLKRTTYEKVCSLGGALMMVYVRDPGSRKLAPYRRYNADIDCVQSQQELNDVNAIGRFFSVFETFTEFQLQCARSIIGEIFET